MPYIFSGLLVKAEHQKHYFDPEPHVAAIHGYSKYWLWNRQTIWILKSNLKTKCDLMLDIRSRGSVRYMPSSSLYPRYSTDSSIVLCMVLMRVSVQCKVLMVLLTIVLNHV